MGTPARCNTTQVGQRVYMTIDLKSFFVSVEVCRHELDPMSTSPVVTGETRTEETIRLVVSPALRTFETPGHPRLFGVITQVKAVNRDRVRRASQHRLAGSLYYLDELQANPVLAVDYLVVRPRMKLYMETSATVLSRYLHWVSPADAYIYFIGEVFVDVTGYLKRYRATPTEFVTRLVHDIYAHTGIAATAGIGKNLYLAKVVMDILAKHAEIDKRGVCLVELTMRTYRE